MYIHLLSTYLYYYCFYIAKSSNNFKSINRDCWIMPEMIKILLLPVCFLNTFFTILLLKNAKKLFGDIFISTLKINNYANIYTLLYVSMYIYLSIYLYIYIYIYMYAYIHLYLCMYLCMYLSIYLSISVSLYICIYIWYCILLQCYQSSNSINVDILHCIYISSPFIFCI